MAELNQPSSIALTTEQAVRTAYHQSSSKHRWLMQWNASYCHEKVCLIAGLATIVVCVISVAVFPASWAAVYPILLGGMVPLAYAVVATENRVFGQHFKAYGKLMNNRAGDPSRLRYLQFINLVRSSGQVQVTHLNRLISAIEARISYRDYFFRRYPVLTVLSAVIAMLTA